MSSSTEEASTKKTRSKSKSSKHISRSERARLKFANRAVFRFLKKGRYNARLNTGVPVYQSDFLEYLAAQVLEIAGIKAKDTSKTQPDDELCKLFNGVTIADVGSPRN
ncbi:hypothetical protein ACP275_08G212800 [Erythranthe tilingii]